MLVQKINNFSDSLKNQNVHNRLYNESIKKKKILNDLQQNYLAKEAKLYTYIPRIGHINKINKIRKNITNKTNKIDNKRKKEKIRILDNKNGIFNINNTFISNGNNNENNYYYNYNNSYILNTVNDLGKYYSKERKNKSKKNKINISNNKLKNKFEKMRKPLKSVKNSNSSLNKDRKNLISKLILDNFLYPLNVNFKMHKTNSKKLNENRNKNYYKYMDINQLNKQNFTINNDLFKDNLYKSNNLYNSSFISNNNVKLNLKFKPPKMKKNTTAHTTNREAKNYISRMNSNQKVINKLNSLNIHSNHSLPGNDFYFEDKCTNINIINNNILNNKYNNQNYFKNLEITRNISDCFSLLFNNNLKINENKIQQGIKSIKFKKLNDINGPKKPKINSHKNSISNLFNNILGTNKKNLFYSINYEHPMNTISKIDFNNKYLFKSKKESLYNLFNKNKNEIKNIIDNKYNTLILEKTKENNIKYESKKKYKKNICNKIVKKKLILNNNNEKRNLGSIKNNDFKIENYSMNILSQKNNNKIYNNNNNSQKIENKMNYKNAFRNNNIYQVKKYETNCKNRICIKDIKKIPKSLINKKYLFNLKNGNINKKKFLEINDIKKDTNKNNKETTSDNLSSHSMTDSKIYELANNYMNLDEFIDKNQIKNILSNKRSKKI